MSDSRDTGVSGAEVYLRVLRDPWAHTFPMEELDDFLLKLLVELALDVQAGFEVGDFAKNGLAICIADPTCPASVPSTEAILLLAAVGPEGSSRVVNAVAKMCQTRDLGFDTGIAAYTALHRLPDGAFMFGHAGILDGTPYGASTLTEIQDRELTQQFVARLNGEVNTRRKAWKEAQADSVRWFCNEDLPLAAYAAAARQLDTHIEF